MKKFILTIVIILFLGLFISCGRNGYEIKPHESAFLIPLNGDTTKQSSFESEKFLEENKIGAKRVVIEKTYIRGIGNVETHLLIRVNRMPITREWTEGSGDGSTKKNQGVIAESKESISFMARFNCTAMIKEKDSAKYLYMYPSNMSLSKVMDDEIRSVIEGKFTEECSNRTMQEIITSKPAILKNVKLYIDKYFAERGITISVLGYKGDFTYLDKSIQDSINKEFKASKEFEAQKLINKKNIEKAEADRKVMEIQTATIEKTLKLKELEIQEKAINKWDGKMPTYSGTGGNIFNIPIK